MTLPPDLRFQRSDFQCKCPGDGKGKPADHYDWCEAKESAEDANALLLERLSKAPEVFSTERKKVWYSVATPKSDTHSARLVCIEKLEGKC